MSEAASLPVWDSATLGDLAGCITSGATPEAGNPRYYTPTNGYAFAKIEDLTRARTREIEHCGLQITEAAVRETAAKVYPVGTILLSMYGTIGLAKICARSLAANQALCALLPPFRCDPGYLLHHLDYVRPLWSRYSGQTTQANINGAIVRAHEVPLPPNGDQVAIRKVLDTVDTTIRQTEAIIEKLKQVKQGLLQDLLTRGITANGELRPPQSEAPHLYKESPLGWIPREWEVRCIGELLADADPAMRSGPFGSALLKSELVGNGIPLLGIDNVHVERFEASFTRFVTEKKFAELARYAVRAKDLMITIMGTVGRCCLVPDDIGRALSSKHTWTITLDQTKYSPLLAMLQINYAPWVLGHFAKDEQGGIMSAIRSDTLRTLRLPSPPLEEQLQMEARLASVSQRIARETRALQKHHLEKAGLMDDLLTGRVRVTSLLDTGADN